MLLFSGGTFRYLSDLMSIEFDILPQDVLRLKLFSNLGKSIDSTHIFLGHGAVSDLSENFIVSSAALQVILYIDC